MMKYITKITLYNSYFDFNNRLTAKSILNIFQDVASIHGEELGVGYEAMLEKNLYWVLSRIKFDIIKMPEINQTVVVETWPHVKGRIDFDRDMKICSEEGELLIIGTSKWCVIDTVNRMLQRTDNINYLGEPCLDINYEDRFNNTNYANLVLNAIENKKINHFEINFINECKDNELISVSSINTEEGEFVSGIVNDKIAFNAYVK